MQADSKTLQKILIFFENICSRQKYFHSSLIAEWRVGVYIVGVAVFQVMKIDFADYSISYLGKGRYTCHKDKNGK
mgnify:CR=1 FL=1